MNKVSLKDVTLTVNVREDRGGDEPRVVVALVVGTPTPRSELPPGRDPNFIPTELDVTVFDSGLLGEAVKEGPGTAPFQLPFVAPTDPVNSGDFVFSAEVDAIGKGEFFLIIAQGWDDDTASDASKLENMTIFRNAIHELRGGTFPIDGNQEKTWVKRISDASVGSDDMIGIGITQFGTLDPGEIPFSIEMSGLDDDARYTLAGTTVWTEV